MHVPLWALRVAPYVGGLLLAGGAYLWAYNRGVDAERAKWRAVQAKAAEVQRQRETALQAIASPAPGDYVYFVAGDDGTVHFARTESEHNGNVAQYCKKLCSQ